MPTLTSRFVTLPQLLEQEPALSRRLLKHWLFCDPDGFRARCVAKIGKVLLFDHAAFVEWLEEHKGLTKQGEDT